MNMKLIFMIVGMACITPAISQRSSPCITPERYYGTCVTLRYCPQIANYFQTTNRQRAEQYVIALQRSCGIRSVNGDPVVCCTSPLTNVRPPVRPVTSVAPNPFFPTAQTSSPQIRTVRPPHNSRNPQIVSPDFNTTAITNISSITPSTHIPTTSTSTTTTSTTATTTIATTTTHPSTIQRTAIDSRGPSCRGPDTREGFCTDIRNCPEILAKIQSVQLDETYTNYLRASNQICGGSNSNVCCPGKQHTASRPAVNPKSNVVPRRLPTIKDGCGYTTNSFRKIVGGTVSKKGAWPWVALLGYADDLSPSPFKCGGALITARHVVTAAHCIRPDLSFVRLGEHDLSTNAEANHVDIRVARSEKHPSYNTRNGHSDVAVVYLQQNVPLTALISPVCLPITPQLRRKSYVRYMPFVVGWGKTMEGGQSSNVLQELQIPIFSNDVCVNSYSRQNRLFSKNQFDSAVICAGVLSGGHDTCQGDSGGPLMIPEPYQNSVRFYLIGIVAYGIGCARPEIPGAYTSVQHFVDWIAAKVADSR